MKYNKVGEIVFVLFMVLLAVTGGQDWRGYVQSLVNSMLFNSFLKVKTDVNA
jgi:hypothetical protein